MISPFVRLIARPLVVLALFAAAAASPAMAAVRVVTTAWPYLKDTPYYGQGHLLGTVPKGTTLTVLEKTNRYYIKVNYNGRAGYISTLFIKYLGSTTTPTARPKAAWEAKADRIIAEARRLMGRVQYQYGKRDPAHLIFDCSSFTQYLYKKEGIRLLWGARAQYKGGLPVAKSSLRKGDLVFLSTSGTAGNRDTVHRIGHVGIYIGGGRFIHNLNPKSDVTISDLTRGWWYRHYVAGARVIR